MVFVVRTDDNISGLDVSLTLMNANIKHDLLVKEKNEWWDKKQHCTQCETIKAEVERLKCENEKLKGVKEYKKQCTYCEGTGRFINSKGKETVMYCHKCNGSGEVSK